MSNLMNGIGKGTPLPDESTSMPSGSENWPSSLPEAPFCNKFAIACEFLYMAIVLVSDVYVIRFVDCYTCRIIEAACCYLAAYWYPALATITATTTDDSSQLCAKSKSCQFSSMKLLIILLIRIGLSA
jgi:hypothetical protein